MTGDNGSEFAYHEKISEALGADFYVAHQYSSWERGLNENTNGLIRQYLKKGSDFNDVTDEDLEKIMSRLNSRPRKTLNYATPNQVFSGFIFLDFPVAHCMSAAIEKAIVSYKSSVMFTDKNFYGRIFLDIYITEGAESRELNLDEVMNLETLRVTSVVDQSGAYGLVDSGVSMQFGKRIWDTTCRESYQIFARDNNSKKYDLQLVFVGLESAARERIQNEQQRRVVKMMQEDGFKFHLTTLPNDAGWQNLIQQIRAEVPDQDLGEFKDMGYN